MRDARRPFCKKLGSQMERALDLDQIRAAIGSLPDAAQREAASENIFLVELVMANERKYT